jgi:spermidine synthase
MYHAGPIGLTTLVIYLFTLFLSSAGFISCKTHRRFWNWLLLATFLVTALFGLFMALKITYKWNIPFAAHLLQWHVEFGIAMAFTAIVHLTWHFRYYFGKLDTSPEPVEGTGTGGKGEVIAAGSAGLLLLLTGFASASSQFILIREAVILGGGAEASTGVFLWLWLMIAAAGAVAGGKSASDDVSKFMWTLIAAMIVSPAGFIVMNLLILSPGQAPSFLQTFVILTVSVAPVSFISSFIFIRLSVLAQESRGTHPGKSFGIETAGSVAAGIITTVTVSLSIPNYQLYLLIFLASATMNFVILYPPSAGRKVSLLLSIPLAILVLLFTPDPAVRSLLIGGVKAETSSDTPFGNITTGSYGGEKTVFYDHRPLFFAGDIISTEENIHYALLQRDEHDRVLVISGGLMRHLPEMQKYGISEVVYLEHDPGIIEAEGARDTVAGTMEIKVEKADPLRYLRKATDRFDAVIQLLPPPSTLAVNRFYTIEYFTLVKEHMTPGGVFMCTPMPWYNYSPESYRRGLSPVYNALGDLFRHIVIIPGSSLYLIASDFPLSDSVSVMAERYSAGNTYVNGDYIDDDDIRRKGRQIISMIDTAARANSAALPVSSWFSNLLSMEKKGIAGSSVALLVILLILPFVFAGRGGLMMFSSSAALAGFGMIMVFLLQITVGSIYLLTALIISSLMAGLAAGATYEKINLRHHLIIIASLLALVFFLTGLLLRVLVTASPWLVISLAMFFTLTAAFLTGSVYRVLTTSVNGMRSGNVYAADLAGAALGYLTVATLLVPLLGPSLVCILLGGIILITVALVSVLIKH